MASSFGGGGQKRYTASVDVYDQVRFHDGGAATFPTEIDASFPALSYTSRRGAIKSAIHWGQRKLLLSEMQLLIEGLEKLGRDTHFIVVYAGSAPGTHLRFLDALFPGHEWILIDPIAFDRAALGSLPNFTLRNEYYTEAVGWGMVTLRLSRAGLPALSAVLHDAVGISSVNAANKALLPSATANLVDGVLSMADAQQHEALRRELPGLELLLRAAASRTPMLFVSDIRSGSVSEEGATEGGIFRGVEFEQHIAQDMRVQMQWVQQLQPTFAMLKFRLPYMEVYHPITKELVYKCPSPVTSYLRGRILLPIWTRPTSTECRLLVPEGAGLVEYDNKRFEDNCYYFNTVAREWTHYDHDVDCPKPELCLDHRYDGAAEVHLLYRYLAATRSASQAGPSDVLELSQRISTELGKPFEQARLRLSHVLMTKAKQRGNVAQQQSLNERVEEHRTLPVWWQRAADAKITTEESRRARQLHRSEAM